MDMIYVAAMLLLIYKTTQDEQININKISYINNKSENIIYSVNMSEVKIFKDLMSCCMSREPIFNINKDRYCIILSDNSMNLPDELKNKKDYELGLMVDLENNDVELFSEEKNNWGNKIIEYYNNILDVVKDNQNIAIKDIEMLGIKEIEQQLICWNNTKSFFPDNKCIHQLIEQKAQIQPDSIAVICNDCTYTRKEVNDKANQLARYIQTNYSIEKKYIAICMDKSIDMIVGILAILKLGCAYLPIDSTYPLERIMYMIKDSEVEIVLTQSALIHNFTNTTHNITVDEISNEIYLNDKSNLEMETSPNDICYLIYTSGSTGNPKGVLVNHYGRVNNFYDFNDRFHINEEDRILAISSLSFDMCAYDVLGSLMAGSVIVLPNPKLSLQPFHWITLIEKYKITIWHSVPTMLEMLIKCKQARENTDISSLRLFLLGGDWIPVSLPNRIRLFTNNPQIISLGGATEVSMDSILYEVNMVDDSWISIPYGKPMRNQTAYILGNDMEFLPTGIVGELYIGGVGVSDGYYNKTELTKTRFFDFCWKDQVRDRIYKTGDLARYLKDGTIQLIGRSDYQVKLDGVRVELGEIEKKIYDYPNVKEVIVICVANEKGKKTLVAFIICEDSDKQFFEKGLREYLKGFLIPKCMPQKYIYVNEFPVTPNGKIARNELIEIAKQFI